MSKSPAFDQRFELLVPASATAIPVPLDQWEKYVKRIEECTNSSSFYDSLGWALTGIGVGAVLAAAALPFSAPWFEGAAKINVTAIVTDCIFALMGLACTISGIVTLVYSKDHRKQEDKLRKVIAEDMASYAQAFLCQKLIAAEPRHPAA